MNSAAAWPSGERRPGPLARPAYSVPRAGPGTDGRSASLALLPICAGSPRLLLLISGQVIGNPGLGVLQGYFVNKGLLLLVSQGVFWGFFSF